MPQLIAVTQIHHAARFNRLRRRNHCAAPTPAPTANCETSAAVTLWTKINVDHVAKKAATQPAAATAVQRTRKLADWIDGSAAFPTTLMAGCRLVVVSLSDKLMLSFFDCRTGVSSTQLPPVRRSARFGKRILCQCSLSAASTSRAASLFRHSSNLSAWTITFRCQERSESFLIQGRTARRPASVPMRISASAAADTT